MREMYDFELKAALHFMEALTTIDQTMNANDGTYSTPVYIAGPIPVCTDGMVMGHIVTTESDSWAYKPLDTWIEQTSEVQP